MRPTPSLRAPAVGSRARPGGGGRVWSSPRLRMDLSPAPTYCCVPVFWSGGEGGGGVVIPLLLPLGRRPVPQGATIPFAHFPFPRQPSERQLPVRGGGTGSGRSVVPLGEGSGGCGKLWPARHHPPGRPGEGGLGGKEEEGGLRGPRCPAGRGWSLTPPANTRWHTPTPAGTRGGEEKVAETQHTA